MTSSRADVPHADRFGPEPGVAADVDDVIEAMRREQLLAEAFSSHARRRLPLVPAGLVAGVVMALIHLAS